MPAARQPPDPRRRITIGALEWTPRPTCDEDLGSHSQKGFSHRALRLQGEAQLAGHVTVDAGPNQFQFIPCRHRVGQRGPRLPDPRSGPTGLGPAHSTAPPP